MIRIVLLIPTLDRSGAEKQFTLLATGLPRDHFDVHVICLTRGGPYEQDLRDHGIPVTVLGKRFRFDPLTLWQLKRLIRRINPDIIHSWLFAGNASARLLFDGRSAPKTVISERCVDSWKGGWQLWLDRRLRNRMARMIGNSESVAEFYIQQGVPRERISVIPNGVRSPSPLSATERRDLLEELKIPDDAKIVGFVGRVARQKRVKDLIWAMQLLRQLTDNVYFLLVGDGPERQRCSEHAEHYGINSLVRMTGHRTDADRVLQLMDVFWLASDFEGMSNSVMEAMAAGIPVVASDIPPNRELVVDGTTGFVVQAGDGPGFAQFADRILADRQLASRLGHAARTRMTQHFSVENMVAAHVELYQQVAAESADGNVTDVVHPTDGKV